MTIINIHGILAREYGELFILSISNPKDVLEAIDCNKQGFLQRLIELQRKGLCYDIIINKTRITHGPDMENMSNPTTIDLVPAIAGSGDPITAAIYATFTFLTGGSTAAYIVNAIIFAAISYALTPKPENEALELTVGSSKGSLIFSNNVNLASQGSPVPIGYGRLIIGSQVIQATIKSYPQYMPPSEALRGDTVNPIFIGNQTS